MFKKLREKWRAWRKPKGDGVHRYNYENHNFNATNTCINVTVFDGGVVGIHVDCPNAEMAEKMYFRVKNDLLNEVDVYRKKGMKYAT